MPDPPSPSLDLSIVVPTFNERERLEELVAAVAAAFASRHLAGEIIIVDDNSPDGTGDHAEELAARYPVRVIRRPGKLGLGSAVMDGFCAARGAVVGAMDADLSHPPDALPGLLAVLLETPSDFVIASRYIPGAAVDGWPAPRLWLSRLACRLASPLTPVRDATSGFFLLRREVVRGVQIAAPGFKICLELLLRGRAVAIAEVPYRFVGRTAGESKMNVAEALGYLIQLWKLCRDRVSSHPRRRPPTYRRISAGEMERRFAKIS